MGVIRRLLEELINITTRIDHEVEKGYNLNDWGEQMKFLHALQIQSQILIDMVLRASGRLGYAPSTPLEAAKYLLADKVIDSHDYRFFRSIVGFRNVVVHGYLSVDMRIVDDILRQRRYRNLLSLAKKIYEYLRSKGLDP